MAGVGGEKTTFGSNKLYELYHHRILKGDVAHDAVLDTCPEVDELRTASTFRSLFGCLLSTGKEGPEILTKAKLETFELLSATRETAAEQEAFEERCMKNIAGCWECELCGFDRNFLQNRHTRQAIRVAANEQIESVGGGTESEGEDSDISWCSNVSRDSGKSKHKGSKRETSKQRHEKRARRKREREKRRAKREKRMKAKAEKDAKEAAKKKEETIGLRRGRSRELTTKRQNFVRQNSNRSNRSGKGSLNKRTRGRSGQSGDSDSSDDSRSRSRSSSRNRSSGSDGGTDSSEDTMIGVSKIGNKKSKVGDPSGAMAGMSESKKARVLQEAAEWVNSRKTREVRFFPRCRLCGRKTGLGAEQKYFLGLVGTLKEAIKLKKDEGILLRKGLPSRRMKVEDEIHKLQSWIVYGAFGADDDPRYHGFPHWAEEIWLLRQSFVERHEYWWCANPQCRYPRNAVWAPRCTKCGCQRPKKNWEYWLAWRRYHYRELGEGEKLDPGSGSSSSRLQTQDKDNRKLQTSITMYMA